MKASQLIRDLANHIANYGDCNIQFIPDTDNSDNNKYEIIPEFKNNRYTDKLFIHIW